MQVYVLNGELSEEEQTAYVQHIEQQHPGRTLEKLLLTVCGEYVEADYTFCRPLRISKMGGYLAGEPATWNKAKRAEAEDTVPHLTV